MTNLMSVRGVAIVLQEYAIIEAQGGGFTAPSQHIISGLTESHTLLG
jgi:hypothetical protein